MKWNIFFRIESKAMTCNFLMFFLLYSSSKTTCIDLNTILSILFDFHKVLPFSSLLCVVYVGVCVCVGIREKERKLVVIVLLTVVNVVSSKLLHMSWRLLTIRRHNDDEMENSYRAPQRIYHTLHVLSHQIFLLLLDKSCMILALIL